MLGALSLIRYARLHENLVAASKLLRDFFALEANCEAGGCSCYCLYPFFS